MNEDSIAPHSVLRSAILSLIPGVVILLFFVLLVPIAAQYDIPALCVLFVAIPLVLAPLELGYLFVQGRRLNGRLSLKGVVLFRERIPVWQFVALVVALLAWMGFCFGTLGNQIDLVLIDRFFRWIPRWFFFDDLIQHRAQYSRTVIVATMSLGLVFNGIIGPIVEELYFRGFLLPRLNRVGWWAPLLNALLFSLYHLFSPWQNVTRMLALVPFVYTVWWKRNIFIGMAAHCGLNTAGMLLTIRFLSQT